MFVICVFSASFLGSFFAYLFIQLLLDLQRSAKELNANLTEIVTTVENINSKNKDLIQILDRLTEKEKVK